LEAATGERALSLGAEVDGDEQLRKATAIDFMTQIGHLAERLASKIPDRVREVTTEQEQQRFQDLSRDLETVTLADGACSSQPRSRIFRDGRS